MTETMLQRARPNSDSLRTSVPSWVVSHFTLEVGDRLGWEMTVVDGALALVVVPKKASKRKK